MIGLLTKNWWAFLIRGILAIIFGLGCFFWPGITVAALIILFGAYVLVDGVITVFTSIASRQELDHWWLYLLQGIAGIAIGVITFFYPGVTGLALLYLIGAWAVITGVFELAAAINLRKEIEGEFWLGLAGVLSILFGLILFFRPGPGALAVLWIIGAYAILFGIAMVLLSFKLKGFQGKVKHKVEDVKEALGS